MNELAARVGTRLLVLQTVVHLGAFFLTAVFAPRVLLLEPAAATGSLVVVAIIGLLTIVFSVAFNLFSLRKV